MICSRTSKNGFVGHDLQNGRAPGNRRTKAEIGNLCDAIFEIVQEHQPVTCRQAFYLCVTAGLIDKAESEYKNTVCRLLAKMRRAERLPYDWVADSTRWQRKPPTYSSMESALEQTANYYRRDLWDRQEHYVEVWIEKDALAGVLYPITAQWHVPLMVSKGFSSLTYLYEAAEAIRAADKPTYLYYFGDRDPSGVHIDRAIERDLRNFAPDAEIHFERVAVTKEQIKKYKLPTRPTKKTDSRCKTFKGRSVEVDAIPPAILKQLVNDCIVQHIDGEALERLQTVERAEREVLQRVASAGFERLSEFADTLADGGCE
jgi:hypothetical protein